MARISARLRAPLETVRGRQKSSNLHAANALETSTQGGLMLTDLPTEVLLLFATHLSPVDQIMVSLTCKRGHQLLKRPKRDLNEQQRISVRKTLIIDKLVRRTGELEQSYGTPTLACWVCLTMHPSAAFFNVNDTVRKRVCKSQGVILRPGQDSLNWQDIKKLLGAPGIIDESWERYYPAYSYNSQSYGTGKPDANLNALTLSSSSVHRTWISRSSLSKLLHSGHSWDCTVSLDFTYGKIYDVTPETLSTALRTCQVQRICKHLKSNSAELQPLFKTLKPHVRYLSDRICPSSSCPICGTRFLLRLETDSNSATAEWPTLVLRVCKDIGRIDLNDPLKEPRWLALADMPDISQHGSK